MKKVDNCSLHIFNLLDLLVDENNGSVGLSTEVVDRRASAKRYTDDTALMPYPSYRRSRSSSVSSNNAQLGGSQQTSRYSSSSQLNSYYKGSRPRGGCYNSKR